MPPWLDTYAPPQYVLGVATNQPPGAPSMPAQAGGGMSASANNNTVDTTLHWKVGGGIIVALIIIFGMQALGFRFVTSANVSIGG